MPAPRRLPARTRRAEARLRTVLPDAALRTAAWCAVLLLAGGVAWIAIQLCVVFKEAVTPVLLALLGMALLGPVHRWLVRRRVPRSLAAGLTCAALVAAVGGVGYVVATVLIDTGGQIVESLRSGVGTLADWFGFDPAAVERLPAHLQDLAKKFGGTAASGVLSGIGLVGQVVTALVLALLLTFFFLRDAHRAPAVLRNLAPGSTAPRLEAVARRAYHAVEGFMRGTTLIALIDAVLITVGLLVLDVPGAFGLGALVFVGAYIPYLGAFISGAVAVLVALADRGLTAALWVLGVIVAVQLLEGHVLQPVIQSRTVQMHPALVMLALTAGASVAGILGMLLAVPLAAAAFGAVSELYRPRGSGR